MSAACQHGEQDERDTASTTAEAERAEVMEQETASFQVRVGRRIKRFREHSRLSQEELAHRAGFTSHALIAQIEAGTRVPTLYKAMRLAHQLGVSLDALVGGAEDGPESGHPGAAPVMHVYGNSVVIGGVTADQVRQIVHDALAGGG
jgi:ribosome-binding protein aMBF1 (putative translation factor)